MSFALEDIGRGERAYSLWAGVIATVPAAVTDTVEVTLPGFGEGKLRFGPCRWQPRVTAQTFNVAEGAEAAHNITVAVLKLPVRGDKCLVAFDDNDDPWIVCWWPA